MRPASALCTLLLAFAVTPALAGGIDLTWGLGCYPETPQVLRTFACNTNSGFAPITASFVPSTDAPLWIGIESTVQLQVQATYVPDWWQFSNSGTCRQSALTTSSDFTSAPALACADPWAGAGVGGITSYIAGNSLSPPAPAWLRLAYALASPAPIFRSVEYYGFRATINFSKTVGIGACAGCTIPVLIVLNEIRSAQNNGVTEIDTTPVSNACVSWQSGSGCQIVPVRNVTWGAVKSMYR